MAKVLNLPDEALKLRSMFGFTEVFDHYISGDRWTPVLTNSGTFAVGDEAGGVGTITCSDGSVVDNDEAYLVSTNELFKFAADKNIVFEADIQYAEVSGAVANIIVGLMDAAAANALQDDGDGPPTSYSGVVFFKADGDTVWSVEASDSTTQVTKQLDADTALTGEAQTSSSSSYQTLRIEVQALSASDHRFTFYIDDQHVASITGFDISNAAEMHVIVGAKNGDGTNQTMKVRRVSAYQAV